MDDRAVTCEDIIVGASFRPPLTNSSFVDGELLLAIRLNRSQYCRYKDAAARFVDLGVSENRDPSIVP